MSVSQGGAQLRTGGIIVVPIEMEQMGGFCGDARFQPQSYSLALQGLMTREEFDAILEQLNATAQHHVPCRAAYVPLVMVPLVGVLGMSLYSRKWSRFKEELSKTCRRISEEGGCRQQGVMINLKVVEVGPAVCGSELYCGPSRPYNSRRQYRQYRRSLRSPQARKVIVQMEVQRRK